MAKFNPYWKITVSKGWANYDKMEKHHGKVTDHSYMKKRILFIISDTGGGHRSAANAIIEALSASGAEATCEMVDLLRASGLPGFRNAPELYAFFSSGHIWLHNFMFRLFNRPRVMDMASDFLYGIARNRVRTVIESFSPDIVVVIHPLAVRPICSYRDETGAAWPVVTVVTDLISVHASWICPRADLYLMPTPEAVAIAERHGVAAAKAKLVGFPVNPRFCDLPPDRNTSRRLLGIDADRFTLLLTSGGSGGGQVEILVRELERECPQCTLLVVTGRNQALHRKLTGRPAPPLHTHVYGFVDNMEQLMAACDAVITKAGPGTIMEAAAVCRPLILTGAVGLQEEGNISFVLDSGIGVLCPTPPAVSRQVLQMADRGVSGVCPPGDFSYAGTRSIAEALLSMNGREEG
jgi:1,2-diacylglycerol 3-beta-galactosyltransferase